MKKKILKWILIVLLSLFCIFFIYSCITAKICLDIYTEMFNKVNNEPNFYGSLKSEDDDATITQEVYLMNNIFTQTVKRTEKNGETVSFKMWQNYNREDPESQTVYLFIEGTANNIKKVDEIKNTNNSKEPDNKMYRYYLVGSLVMGAGIDFQENHEEYNYIKMLKAVLKHPIIIYTTEFNGEKCYAIKYNDMGVYLYEVDEEEPSHFKTFINNLLHGKVDYISKNTKLPVGTNFGVNGAQTTYSYFSKDITEDDIKMPDLSKYELTNN